MKPTSSPAGQAVTLSYLLIESASFSGREDATASLYANGNQQSRIIVTLEARDSEGQATELPLYAQIELIPYSAQHAGMWKVSRSSYGYEEFPERSAVVNPSTDSVERKSYTFYVSNINPETSTLTDRFAVKVTWGDVEFRSNYAGVPYGGNGKDGEFNSSVQLHSVPAQKYRVTQGPAEEVFRDLTNDYTGVLTRIPLTITHPTTGQAGQFNTRRGPNTSFASLDHNKAAVGAFRDWLVPAIPDKPERLTRAIQSLISRIRSAENEYSIFVACWARTAELFTSRQSSLFQGPHDIYGNPVTITITLVSSTERLEASRQELQQKAYWENYELSTSPTSQ